MRLLTERDEVLEIEGSHLCCNGAAYGEGLIVFTNQEHFHDELLLDPTQICGLPTLGRRVLFWRDGCVQLITGKIVEIRE